MSFQSSHSSWPTPAGSQGNGFKMNHAAVDGQSRPNPDAPMLMPEASDSTHDEDHQRRAHFANLFRKTDAKIAALFADDGDYDEPAIESLKRPPTATAVYIPPATDHTPIQQPPLKRAKRVIIDDYDDDDEDEEEEGEQSAAAATQLQNDNAAAAKTYLSPSKSGSSPVHSVSSPGKNGERAKEDGAAQGKEKSSEDARKELEEARNATEEAAKRSFHTMFYTLENDRTAMLEQQQLEESEKQIQAEMDKNGGNVNDASGQNHGSLSSANLGASSLTLKHLIARIDMKRSQVQATDQELRSLMNEVRKNRSKWASEESVGQEELYEALEKVLSELKAHTEYSTPFLTKVSKRDAPDYYSVIKQPMDLGTMTKKLKQLQYKSKADFVADLNLIWDNCLRYNQNLSNHLPRLANGMRREADKLIPLIPEIIVRPRAEVEAEERRKQNGGEDDGGDDSDDEPIITSRGRSNATKGAAKSRTAPSDQKEETPTNDAKPTLQINGILAKTGREGSEMADGSNGFGTPPVGSFTPIGPHGQSGTSNADAMEIDGPSLNGMGLNLGEAAEQEFEGEEYKIWKQVTKKDRALVARERYNIFKDNKLNPDEPGILRTKAGMRRVLRSHKRAELADNALTNGDAAANEATKLPETLAEGMEVEDDRALPDYYETSNLIPDVLPKLQWLEDDEGQVINQHEEMLRLIQPGHFVAPESILTKKFHGNLRQMQETRKVCSKIGVIKQMQIQTQVYANQFPKYELEPFHEVDIEPHFIAGDVPVMAPDVCKAALKRSVAQIFYHAGFEELQPSALDVVTEIAGDYFGKIIHTLNVYREADKVNATGKIAERGAKFQPRFTQEEVILHALNENGHSLESIEGYAKDDVDRLGSKLGVIHDRMKSHLADLLRPALNDGGPDGAGAFKDGSDQFVGGDFAEELGEDFFGFKALGLVEELGLDMLSVPLHLLQSRVRNTYQAQTQTVDAEVQDLFDALPPTEPVTKDNIQGQIGLVKNFFLAKLHANGDQPLVEDEDLPVKQRRPRPRLGATGKIVSPQKRPPKEQIALAKKKKKLEAGKAQITDPKPATGAAAAVTSTPEKAKKMTKVPLPPKPPIMERMGSTQSQSGIPSSPPGDNKDDIVTMLSPESTGQ